MKAIRAWTAAEMRSRWKGWLGLALVLGMAGGTVIASAAGARRTDTAYTRFLAAQEAADVVLLDDGTLGVELDPDAVSRLPQVSSVAKGSLIFYSTDNNAAVAAVDDRLGVDINRFKVISGRMYDPARPEEIVVGFAVARRTHLKVGSRFPLVEAQFAEQAAAFGIRNITLQVVGIVAAPGEFPPQYTGLYPSIHMSPAFYRAYGNALTTANVAPNAGTLFIRLKRGEADAAAFKRTVETLTPGKPAFLQTASEAGVLTRRAFHFQAIGLWLLAAFGSVALTLVVGQALARQAMIGAADFPTLRSFGMTPGDLWLLGILRAAMIGTAGAVIAAVVATALSPLAPVGDARLAEPHPGLLFDAYAIGIGCTLVIAMAIVVSVFPAWRAARVSNAVGGAPGAETPSLAARVAERASLPVTIVAGTRLALEPGRGRTSVPVRSALAGIAIGIAVLAAALTFGASLNHLLATPELYGARWDAFITNYGDGPDMRAQADQIGAIPGIEAFSVASDGIAEIGSETVSTLAVRTVRGDVIPALVEGRSPGGPEEIALGSTTFRRMHARLGSSVTVRIPIGEQKPVVFTVVGRTVMPPSGGIASGPGEGALLSFEGQARLVGDAEPRFSAANTVLIRFSPGADHDAVVRALSPLMIDPTSETSAATDVPLEKPVDVVNFGRVQNLPVLLGSIIGLIACMTLAHTVVSGVRRRRADLAVLKTIGLVSGQVRATVAWQATILTVTALIVGLPVGVAVGRWGWTAFADRLGMVPRASVRPAEIMLLVPGAVILANAIAALPGLRAARLPPATVLRAE
jgi:putative ABC transport system permease protein